MNINKKNLLIQLLALVGLGLAIKLAFIYHVANYDKYALSSFCSINDFIDCDGVAKTNSAQFLGIPLAWWGIFFYLVILFLTILLVIHILAKFSSYKITYSDIYYIHVYINMYTFIYTYT